MRPTPLPPMDGYTVETLEHIGTIRGRCLCTFSGVPPVPGEGGFLTFDQYAALLESREITAYGTVRCAGWAPSQNRRCAFTGHEPRHGLRVRWSECCAHPGVWLDNTSQIGEWYCERHGGQ